MLKSALKAATSSIVILAATVLTAQIRRQVALGASNSAPLVHAIIIHNSPTGTIFIDIRVTRPVPYRTFSLSSPERLVVDLKGAIKAVPRSVYPDQSQLLGRVRVGQWQTDPAVVRVVADLEGTPAFTVRRWGGGIRIKLKPPASDGIPVNRSRVNQRRPDRDPEGNRSRALRPEPTQKSPFTVHQFKDLSASLAAPELPPQSHLIPITRPKLLNLSRELTATAAVVSGISIKSDGRGKTFVDIASSRAVPYRVFQLTNPFRLVVDLKDAHDASRRKVYPVGSSVLKRIRVAQWRPGDPPVVRVVADLQGYPIFDVHAEQPGIRIELMPRRKLSPLIRNPFEFANQQSNAHLEHAVGPSNHAMTAAANSPAAAPGNSFSGLKVIGFIEKKNSGTQAVISDRANIYVVPDGGTFENTFRVIAISRNEVQVQNVETLDKGWLAYHP